MPILEEKAKNGQVNNTEDFRKVLDEYRQDLVGSNQKEPPAWSLRSAINKLVSTTSELGKDKLCELLLQAYLGDGELAASISGPKSYGRH